MKKNKLLLIITSIILLFNACKKIENQQVSKVVKVTYPGLVLKGDEGVTINVGDPYTDAGATLTDDITGAVSDVAGDISGVDVNTEGLYFVTFTASNANGFSTTIQRPVAVTNISDIYDISGEYLQPARGGTAILTKVSRGLFKTDNINGGASSLGSAYFIIKGDGTMEMPEQYSVDGAITPDFVDESIRTTPDTAYEYSIALSGFSPSIRDFIKQ